ncbi:arsenate reductase (glutaredoxin) [Haoranjiania flava]|uniref:Arsenate reductase (Glutaredoxin) n=1 Tax=Haoranjiania flava TaxID=1856322 RepID=A0AAE3ILA2_9BACT|nr:arsenate reductase (glutaredoxin) [Haoranjiania flava]MCU7693739.1 arsenate reductase (glutaredoxin) [Haoranjiania flava]
MITIIHNPHCSKSNCSLDYLQDLNYPVSVRNYITNPLTVDELEDIIDKLGIQPEQLVRKNEQLYKQNFEGNNYSDEEWISILAENPVLIERPIIIKDDKAIIGRPFEKVAAFMNEAK